MLDLFGPPPLLVNGTVLTLEHVTQWLDIIEIKMDTVDFTENLDKKIHNHVTQYGSRVGVTLKNLKEKEPIVNEKIDLDSARIGKLEDIITNLGSAFSSMKNTPKCPTKTAKFIYVPKNKGESSSKGDADLKSISVHPNCLSIVKEPFATNEFIEFLPKGLILTKKGETPKDDECSTYEFSAKEGTR